MASRKTTLRSVPVASIFSLCLVFVIVQLIDFAKAPLPRRDERASVSAARSPQWEQFFIQSESYQSSVSM